MKKIIATALIAGICMSTTTAFASYHVSDNGEVHYYESTDGFNGIHNYYDVDYDDWFAMDVNYVLEIGLMKGKTASQFDPNGFVTRAELAQIVYNMVGAGTDSETLEWPDVSSTAWYHDAVYKYGRYMLYNANDTTLFNPEGRATRGDVAFILLHINNTVDDIINISDYRKEAILRGERAYEGPKDDIDFNTGNAVVDMRCRSVVAMLEQGLMSGYDDGSLRPNAAITRAEIAALINRYMSK